MYCETQQKLGRVIRNKRHVMLTSGLLVVLLYGHVPSRTAARTRLLLLQHFNWELFDHPSHSSDLAPRDYYLFTYPKYCVGSQRFNNNEELIEVIKTWLSSQASLVSKFTLTRILDSNFAYNNTDCPFCCTIHIALIAHTRN
jgi:hypothetical protein